MFHVVFILVFMHEIYYDISVLFIVSHDKKKKLKATGFDNVGS